jgi:transmembrane sensor
MVLAGVGNTGQNKRMDRKAFISLLQRYLEGTCSPKEKQMLDNWYQLLNQEEHSTTHELHQTELEERLWSKIQQEIQPVQKPLISPVTRLGWLGTRARWVAAASVLIIFGLVYFTLLAPVLQQKSPLHLTEGYTNQHQEKNNGKTSRWVLLEDSSRVFLGPGSTLDYPVQFAEKKRILHLTGSAFFEVTKDAARPFLVYSGDIVTKVVGTSFSIRSGDDDTEVAVVTGKVIVEKTRKENRRSRLTGGDGVVLTPNQKVTYFSRNKYFVTGLVEAPALIPKVGQDKPDAIDFQFEETPLDEVLHKLETAYGLDILLANEELANCPITADLTTQPLYTKLNIICAALRTSYEVKGTSILLTGGNCL